MATVAFVRTARTREPKQAVSHVLTDPASTSCRQVQGCRSLHASLRQFVQEERFTGDNKYNTRDPDLGRQEARRAVRFKSLPPILQMHLKRFEYDVETGGMHKLQQAFSFPTRLRMHRFMARGATLQPPPDYTLHAVLSHVGDAGGGHYISYVRPRGSRQWYEFDDTRVTKVPEDVAVRQQFGGSHSRRSGWLGMGAAPNAYMLVYVRADLAAAGGELIDEALPPEVRAAFERQLGRGTREEEDSRPTAHAAAGAAEDDDLFL